MNKLTNTILTLLVVQFLFVGFDCVASELETYTPESQAFKVLAPGKVRVNRIREDSKLRLRYRWNNSINTQFEVLEGYSLNPQEKTSEFIERQLNEITAGNYSVVSEAQAKGPGWSGKRIILQSKQDSGIDLDVLFAVSSDKDLLYILQTRPLFAETKQDSKLTDQFFNSFEIDTQKASDEQRGKNMNSLGYSIGPIILAVFIFGFVFTIFFVLGVIFYRMRKS